MRWALEIIELSIRDRPPERRSDQECEHDRKRDQEVEDFHGVPVVATEAPEVMRSDSFAVRGLGAGVMRASRHALATTRIEEADMPNAATSGDKCPDAARGIEIAL